MTAVTDPTSSRPPNAPVVRTWGVAVLLLAAAIFVLGGGATNFRPVSRDLVAEDTPIPVGIEPEGVQDTPPTVFRWTPGGDDVDLTQLILYRADKKRLWQSAPTRAAELEVPLEAYRHIPAGETLYWRVREVRRGKARAASAFVAFWFQIDLQGKGPGETPHTDIMRQ
jgi:predicted phage tail protein